MCAVYCELDHRRSLRRPGLVSQGRQCCVGLQTEGRSDLAWHLVIVSVIAERLSRTSFKFVFGGYFGNARPERACCHIDYPHVPIRIGSAASVSANRCLLTEHIKRLRLIGVREEDGLCAGNVDVEGFELWEDRISRCDTC